MRIPFFVVAAWVATACTGATSVDDLFDPNSGDASNPGKGGTGGTGGATGGSGGVATGGTGGAGGATGGTGGATGGTGGTAGTGGTTGGTGGSAGTGGTAGVPDSGLDVRRDVAPDTRDAGGAKSIKCGTTTCDPATAFCCLQNNMIRCVATGGTCVASADRLHCDDTADCPSGTICCAAQGTGSNGADSTCVASSTCLTPKQMMCDSTVTGPCLGSVIVTATCSANGSGLFQDYPYCHLPP